MQVINRRAISLFVCCLLGLLAMALLVAACGPATPTPTKEPVVLVPSATWTLTPAPTATASPLPTLTPLPTPVAPSEPLTVELKATVVAGLPPTPTPETPGGESSWGGVEVLPLETGDGEPPLWAAFTVGMGFYDWEHGHTLAVYTYDDEGWQMLSQTTLTNCADYVSADSLRQVAIEPSRIWLELESYTGTHGGCYDLLSFDGETLRHEVTHFNSSPGVGQVADLNGDGQLEVILNWTENYVFCYACGVRLPIFDVLRWDGEQLVEVELTELPESAPAELRELNNRAVALAQAGLWKDAADPIAQAEALDDGVVWNSVLIQGHAEGLREEVEADIYPLLANVFYGDYEAAVEVMRPYDAKEIWGPDSPLIVDTAAEGWETALSNWITWTTELALEVRPEMAPAYFLQGWAIHLTDPDNPEVRFLVGYASELDPNDALFAESLAYLDGSLSTPTPTSQPLAVEQWQVRTLLAGPGSPGRLYALLTEISSGAWPAERARLLVSDDYGATWSPFPGGLPAAGCVRNVNLDYAAQDALYASTCQGLYRWTGAEWAFVSPQETGMVAIVYGQPETIWATGIFVDGVPILRSDDGGATWLPAADGLIQFSGVANIGIDPRDANTLYAVIWPKYAGSYLRRGTAAGQWQTMPTPLDNSQIDTGITIDGATGALYVAAFTGGDWQLWRTLNPAASDMNNIRWALVSDFGPDVSWAALLASGWGPDGLALYANLSPWVDRATGQVGPPALYRSLDGGLTWEPLPIP